MKYLQETHEVSPRTLIKYLQDAYEISTGQPLNISSTPIKYLQDTNQISPGQQ